MAAYSAYIPIHERLAAPILLQLHPLYVYAVLFEPRWMCPHCYGMHASSFYTHPDERAVKRAILEYRRLDPLEEGRLKVLRLPPPRTKPPTPQNGLLPVTEIMNEGERQAAEAITPHPYYVHQRYPNRLDRLHDFEDLLTWSSSHLFAAQVGAPGLAMGVFGVCLHNIKVFVAASLVAPYKSHPSVQGVGVVSSFAGCCIMHTQCTPQPL